jgi:hypothetical protein
LEVGSDQLGELDQQRVVHGGHVDELFPEVVEHAVGESGEVRDRLACERCDVRAGELFLGWAALLSAAAFGLAA